MMADTWKISLFAFCLTVLLAYTDGDAEISEEPVYNEFELMVLEDLRSQAISRGFFDVFEPPKCWFEDFTAACCVKMKFRTGNKTKDGKDIMGKHRACIEAGIEFTELKAFVRAVYDGEVIGKEFAYRFGKICWPLPEPLSNLQVCIWIWHVNITVKEKFAECCFLFSLTKYLHVKFDCIRWHNGNFDLHNKILPTKEQAIFSIYFSTRGIGIDIKNNYLIKMFKSLKKVWQVIKGLFGKSEDMKTWIKKIYDGDFFR